MADEFMGDQPAQPEAQTSAPAQGSDLNALLASITTPDGRQKYATPEAALIGLANAQAHIQTLEQENATYKGLATKVDTMEALLQRLGEQRPADQPQAQTQGQAPQAQSVDIEQTVLSVLEKASRQNQERANRQSVKEQLTKRFGDKADEALQAKAASLGLSVAQLGELAARSPAAVLEFFKDAGTGTPGVRGSVNTQGIAPSDKPRAEPPKDLMHGGTYQEAVGFLRALRAEIEAEMTS